MHVANLICAQQMCCKCEAVDDMNVDYEQCVKLTHVFWQDLVGKFLDYLRQSRPFADKIYILSHNSCGYDAQFLLQKCLELRWTPQLIMDGTRIVSMVVENLHFLDSLNYLPMNLKSLPKSLDLTCKKGYYSHFFNRPGIWNTWALIPNPSSVGQTTYQVMSEPSFWKGTGSKRTKCFAMSKNSWPTAWTMSVSEFVFEIGQDGPFSAGYNNIVHL